MWKQEESITIGAHENLLVILFLPLLKKIFILLKSIRVPFSEFEWSWWNSDYADYEWAKLLVDLSLAEWRFAVVACLLLSTPAPEQFQSLLEIYCYWMIIQQWTSFSEWNRCEMKIWKRTRIETEQSKFAYIFSSFFFRRSMLLCYVAENVWKISLSRVHWFDHLWDERRLPHVQARDIISNFNFRLSTVPATWIQFFFRLRHLRNWLESDRRPEKNQKRASTHLKF